LSVTEKSSRIRDQIHQLVAEYFRVEFSNRCFQPGESPVPVAGRVFDEQEMQLLVDSALDFWLTTGHFAARFERALARWVGQRNAILVNSGSSANLLALSCLTSPKLGERRIKAGDEVITAAAGFPTTVNPIIQNGLIPVFVDVDPCTLQVRAESVEAAISERTRCIMIAHTLGNPFDAATISSLARRDGFWLIEDCCDALGSLLNGRQVGTFGDLATVSFYPAHHITMGEGGCVLTDQPLLKTLVESFRDWGRDCWCDPGKDNTCGKRYDWQLGGLPQGYDHKYMYSHIGYNLKATDMQAAVGVAQLAKLPGFIEARKANFRYLYERLRPLEDVLLLPQATPGSDPSWFGFPVAVRPSAPFERAELLRHLDARHVGTRLLFGGNLTRQPAYMGVQYRVAGDLSGTDFVMRNTFWVGIFPGLTEAMLDYTVSCIQEFVRSCSRTGLPRA
jgi:CDP-6-deoxy-D-xylo-4-hexulose-3-dehydrase